MQEELLAIWEKTRLSTLYVTHNIAEAVRLADRIVVLSRRPGRIIKILAIDMPRTQRALPENAAVFSAWTEDIWQSIKSGALEALREVDEHD